MENKVRAIVLSDLTINAAQTNDYDRATALVADAIELTYGLKPPSPSNDFWHSQPRYRRRTTEAPRAPCGTKLCPLSAGSASGRSGRTGFVGDPRQVIAAAPDNRQGDDFRHVVAVILLDVFGERIESISAGLYPTLPLLIALNAAPPTVDTANWPDNLDTRPKTCLYDPPSEFLGRLHAVSRRDHRAV